MTGFDETLEKLKGEIEENIAALKSNEAWSQVEKLFRALGTIEELAGVEKTTLADLFGFADAGSSAIKVKRGEFIGMDPVAAAKLYLQKKESEAATLDEIMEAIQVGGAQSADRDKLRISLARSTWDVVKAPDQELYQLLKYAPHVKRGKKKTASEPQALEPTPDSDSEAEAEKEGGETP
jgi:hypothetical protein